MPIMSKVLQFIISSLIWFCLFLPMVLLSFLVVPALCLTQWEGKTTWFGNFKYGRGDTHYKAPSEGKYWKQVRFLCIRNPVSNFGKQVLSLPDSLGWPLSVLGGPWLIDQHVVGTFYWMYGWKNPVDGMRTFVYRPWFKKDNK